MNPGNPPPASEVNENLEGNILRLKLIQAFQNGSKEDITDLLQANSNIVKLSKAQGPLGPSDLYVLHMAVQLAPLDIVRYLVTKYKDAPAFDINAVEPTTGNTPLHVAAMYDRSDVVMYLLSFDDIINDTITNNDGKQPVEVAQTPELAEAMQVVRAQYVEKVATQMKYDFTQSNIPALEQLLSNPRAAALLDINGQDPDTGYTVLHDFVRAGNVPMVEFILNHGGDPLQRNSKGVLPSDLTKNDTIRKMLKNSTKSQKVLVPSAGISPAVMKNRGQLVKTTPNDPTSPTGTSDDASAHPSLLGPPPTMKGFLKKWTNFTGGYKLRWFVLENNTLSYYKRQNDTERACRGSINMKQARLHVDSTEKVGFEVLSSTSVKFHLKAKHPVETARWVWALTNAIQYAKDEEKVSNLRPNHRRFQSSGSNMIRTSNAENGLGRGDGIAPALSPPQQFSAIARTSSNSTAHSNNTNRLSQHMSSSIAARPQSMIADDVNNNVAKLVQMNNSEIERRGNFDKDEEEDDDDDEYENEDDATRDKPPFTTEVKSTENSITAGLTSINSVITSLSSSSSTNQLSPDELQKGLESLNQACSMIEKLISQYMSQISSRESYYQAKIERANQSQDLWAKAIHDLELEKGKVQDQLHEAIQKKRTANKMLREVAGTSRPGSKRPSIVYPLTRGKSILVADQELPVGDNIEQGLNNAFGQPLDPNALSEHFKRVEIESESESELEDEFFDALGSGAEGYVEEPKPPNVFKIYKPEPQPSHPAPPPPVTSAALAAPVPVPSSDSVAISVPAPHPAPSPLSIPVNNVISTTEQVKIPHAVSGPELEVPQQKTVESTTHAVSPPAGPRNIILELPTDLKKPMAPSVASGSTIAPSVLEKEVADDLTPAQHKKLVTLVNDNSFAGYEDGPRQRLTLDADDRPKISLWGVLKNLVGKDMTRMTLPVSFNECTNLLQRSAEDMEYTDLLDKAASITDDPGERMAYVAAFAASSYSSTIGRVAKPFNPLLGETFEYARPDMGYRMFSEQVSHHPPIGAMMAESPRWDFYGASNVKSKFTGRSFDINPLGLWYIKLRPNKGAGVEEESYSFRKVTSTVVGIITGNPVVDQYGDMEITNYTLGYKCLLKFKARGWLSDSAYEVRGTVYNKEGIPQWIVGGRWNDKIFGKKVHGDDVKNIAKGKEGDLGEKSDRVLLWRVHERAKAPFSLTPFAITLNALPEKLASWLPRTDTRFRPDQRAMEEGQYDEASDEKHRVEEKQRAKRREREANNEVYSPRWFEKQIHPLSGQEYWSYKGDYWEERKGQDWVRVPDIF